MQAPSTSPLSRRSRAEAKAIGYSHLEVAGVTDNNRAVFSRFLGGVAVLIDLTARKDSDGYGGDSVHGCR
ncbi:protein of unknown function [Methylocaldum szegediense]|uniref:Uncharacterized protein n=1 Tax=Methylocaldum szegediense TaxID=73780 RepID=A0ABM9I5G8_9GAMM|nr:protein of unknown function [Methylocaldum szegediense]